MGGLVVQRWSECSAHTHGCHSRAALKPCHAGASLHAATNSPGAFAAACNPLQHSTLPRTAHGLLLNSVWRLLGSEDVPGWQVVWRPPTCRLAQCLTVSAVRLARPDKLAGSSASLLQSLISSVARADRPPSEAGRAARKWLLLIVNPEREAQAMHARSLCGVQQDAV